MNRKQNHLRRTDNRKFNNNNNNNSYNNHDNRTNNNNRNNIQSRLGVRRKGGKYNRNNFIPRSRQNQIPPDETFFRITIPHPMPSDDKYIASLIRENMVETDNFTVFYNFKKVNQIYIFYVMGQEKAETLKALNKRIQTNTGQRLSIGVYPAPAPLIEISDDVKASIHAALNSRYNSQNNIMNLEKFYDCDIFREKGLYLPLCRPNILHLVIQQIILNAPNTVAINLRNNRIKFIESLQSLKKLSYLKALDLSMNNIQRFSDITDNLKDLNLIEIVLMGNPFTSYFDTTALYISNVRKLFKELKTLDKKDLPDQIGFDVEQTVSLPLELDSFIPDVNLKNFISGFLQEYYRMYDSDRQQLIVAYHEQSMFTLTAINNYSLYRPNELTMENSHNLLNIREREWVKKVKMGNNNIVTFLNKLPVTMHLMDSFKVDVPLFNKNFINFVINGMLKETMRIKRPYRQFCRTFVLIPKNDGFVIINDMFNISAPSLSRINKYENSRESTTTSSTIEMNECLVNDPQTIISQASSSINTSDEREQIVQKFMQATKMNRHFSYQCLSENNFNPTIAFDIFTKLQQANAVPAEAFK